MLTHLGRATTRLAARASSSAGLIEVERRAAGNVADALAVVRLNNPSALFVLSDSSARIASPVRRPRCVRAGVHARAPQGR